MNIVVVVVVVAVVCSVLTKFVARSAPVPVRMAVVVRAVVVRHDRTNVYLQLAMASGQWYIHTVATPSTTYTSFIIEDASPMLLTDMKYTLKSCVCYDTPDC